MGDKLFELNDHALYSKSFKYVYNVLGDHFEPNKGVKLSKIAHA